MSDLIRSGYVNWVDGMKMSKTHLLQMQQAVEDRLSDARGLHDPFMDHGLLGTGPGGEAALDLSLSFEGRSKYLVELRQCRAVTPAGSRVELLSSDTPLRLNGEVPEQLMVEGDAFDIVLRASSTLKEPLGTPDPAESPIRHPFLRPAWTIEMAPVKELRQSNGSGHLTIARMRVVKNELEQDHDHIPAALFMSSMPQLEEFVREYAKFLKDVERDLMRIVIKLNVVKDLTELQTSVDFLCRSSLRFLETGIAPIVIAGTAIRPREIVMHAAQFARTLHHAIELLTGRGKDALLDYVREHTGLKSAEHVATITGLLDLTYDHGDLRGALGTVTRFCRTHKKLFDMWVGLDYIGQKKDKDIFIAQDTSTTQRSASPRQVPISAPKPQKPASGWDF
ncbi:MAG: hypothetical protein R2815_11595 [Flavobacteriales bacterium]